MTCKTVLAYFLAALPSAMAAQNYELSEITAQRFVIDSRYDRVPDAVAAEVLAPFLPAVDSLQQPVLGTNAAEMWVGRPECPLGNWTADMLMAEARSMGIKAEVAVTNIGGLRASMPQGVVRLSHIFEIAPFDNRLCTLVLRGSDLLELCRNIAGAGGEGTSGLTLTISHDGQLIKALVGGREIDEGHSYIVATLDYLAEGNDRMTAFKRATAKQVHERPVRDIYIDAIRRETKAKRKLHAAVESRITVLGGGGHQAPAIDETPTLTILHTNDTHSQILPVSPNVTKKETAGRGGYLRRAAFIKEQRSKRQDMLLFDAGDFSQGTLFYNLYKGETEVRLMNHIGYDAVAIGNHEFDNGLENMAQLFRMATFPIVCSNYDFTGTPCEGLVKPYIIIYRGGLKIGVFGLGCALEGMVAGKNCEGVRFIPPVEAADSMVGILRDQERCDLIVCLSHLGWMDEAGSDCDVLPRTSGIDIVVGGHSHTYMKEPQFVYDRDNHAVADFQMGKSGCYVGCFELTFRRAQ